MDSYKKILIIRLSAVGDVIRTIPTVKALKSFYPFSNITWVVEEPSKEILESQPEIDNVIIFPRKRWLAGLKSINAPKIIIEVVEFILKLRKERFDIVLDFHGILKSGLLSFLSGSPKRIGFDRNSSKELNYIFSNIKVKLYEERINRFKRNMQLLKGIGLEIKEYKPELNIPLKDREYIESFFSSLSPPPQKPIIAIHPGTSAKTIYKRWMSDRYAQLADRLIEEIGSTIIFTWGPDELELINSIRKEMRGKSLLGPKTKSLITLGELFRRCDLYIGGDTGPMHVASLVGTPVVVIYGPTDPVINEPFGLHKKVMKEVGCNPCRNRSCKKLICLKSITVNDVIEATKEILNLTK